MTYRRTGDLSLQLLDSETAGGWAIWGITGAIQTQHNVISVTDNGVGNWVVNWAVAFDATTYALAGCTRDQTSGSVGSILALANTDNSITAASANVWTSNSTGARRDPTDGVYLVAIGRR